MANTIKERDIVLWVNISLIGVVLLLLFYYVMIANTITAKNYKAQTFKDQMRLLSEINSDLTAQKLLLETPSALSEFARSRSFIEAKNISYIFENKNVAQR